MGEVTDEQKKVITQMENLLIMTFNTMKKACSEKCLKRQHDQSDVVKNEAVCMDRCVAKYMELHDIIGRRLSRDKDTYDLLANGPYQTKSEKSGAVK